MLDDQAGGELPTDLRSVVSAAHAGAVPPTCQGRCGATARRHDVAARAPLADRDPPRPELTNCSIEVAGGCQVRFSWGVPVFSGLTRRSRPHGCERQVGQEAGWDHRAPYRTRY
jgi:hypothetical protein